MNNKDEKHFSRRLNIQVCELLQVLSKRSSTQINSRRDKLYKKFKHSGLETDKDTFKVTEIHLQKMILKKKKSYFEELEKNKNKPKELWKTLKSFVLSSNKARQSTS